MNIKYLRILLTKTYIRKLMDEITGNGDIIVLIIDISK